MLLYIIPSLLFIAYTWLICYYWRGWEDLNLFEPVSSNAKIKFSIIVPARNEEANIARLLTALQQQNYPKENYEVIVINDNSTDNTAGVVSGFSFVKLLHLPASVRSAHKKKAIELGIVNATNDWIVTTDADCLPQADWLATIAAFQKNKNAVFIAAPVALTAPQNSNTLLYNFQCVDFCVLQGITGASVHRNFHTMCNGANLAYKKSAYEEVHGFAGIANIASGDDMLLMYKIWKKYPQQVFYLKSKQAIVETAAMNSWKNFFQQRIRWASKARHYDDKRIFTALLVVYLFNFLFPVLLFAAFWFNHAWWLLLLLWLAKTIIEFPFAYSVTRFFNRQKFMWLFIFFQPLHILYIIASGFFGLFSYEWKGRKVK